MNLPEGRETERMSPVEAGSKAIDAIVRKLDEANYADLAACITGLGFLGGVLHEIPGFLAGSPNVKTIIGNTILTPAIVLGIKGMRELRERHESK